jgi:RecF/RecN/SMC N terminal domain.
MYEIIGRELKKWRDNIDITLLDEYDLTVVNIILNHYEKLIESGGTAAGKRAKKFAEYVNSKNCQNDKGLFDLTFGTISTNKKIRTIDNVIVDSFRGFSVSRKFDLQKPYVFLYGPNGSGKSSFSEALEYGLLGIIQEAEANKIKLATYIKNTTTNKGKTPEILCTFEDGTKGEAYSDYDFYRFAFVEKNRISDFSHISVLNAKTQSERIAGLFGLSEFSEFVQGFTTNFDEKYLYITSTTEEQFKEKRILRDSKEEQIKLLNEQLVVVERNIKEVIEKLEQKQIENVNQAINYLEDPQNGVLIKLISQRDMLLINLITEDTYTECKKLANIIRIHIDNIEKCRGKLSDQALQVDYKGLFEAVIKLEETENCPACDTPIKEAKRNPYEYAKTELKVLSEITLLQEKIEKESSECKKKIQEMINFICNHKELILLMEIDTVNANSISENDAKQMKESVKSWNKLCSIIMSLDDVAIHRKIKEYNQQANDKNIVYNDEIKRLSEIRNQINGIEAQRKEKENLLSQYIREIKEFDDKSSEILKQIDKEKRQAKYNKKIIASYDKVIGLLMVYNKSLPVKISKNLEERIMKYYNVINQDDADFEKFINISLPTENTDKLMITFGDNTTAEALHVLSEGHIKILGLSILLSKAVQDNLNFIIFDDIVNAIDDDHRNGVADLLMNHEDFQNMQMILSTHGDQFIFKLQDKLGKERSRKDAIIYKFMPADSLEERGVVAEYSDAKAPLDVARIKYTNNELTDSASKCRQAMECISYNLWNIISKTKDGMISVGMRSPKGLPDLSSIVDALIKKSSKIKGMEDIYLELQELKRDCNWRVLNKGTHYEDEKKEFERQEVSNVLNHLEKLDDLVRNFKIVLIASV